MSNAVTVQLGEELFSFHSQQHWVNKGRSWFANCGVPSWAIVCLDARGRVVARGAEFQRAEDDGAYPVTAYSIAPA